jgi:hypothetical protein
MGNHSRVVFCRVFYDFSSSMSSLTKVARAALKLVGACSSTDASVPPPSAVTCWHTCAAIDG